MSPDATISALKQGNALELEFVEKLKEGLDFIADGMQTECCERGDALEELRESLEPVLATNAAGLTATLIAEKKAEVTKLIKDGIRECHEANGISRANYDRAQEESGEATAVDNIMGQEACKTQIERHASLVILKAALRNLFSNPELTIGMRARAMIVLNEALKADGLYHDDQNTMQEQQIIVQDRAEARKREAMQTCREARSCTKRMEVIFEAIAKAVGMEKGTK